MRQVWIIYTFYTFITTLINVSTSCFVKTPLGKIIGQEIFFDGIPVYTFQGIPFAEPPIGLNRFKKPIPVGPYNKTIIAKHKPPACVQYSSNPFPWLDDLPGHSEDCLYLNIWTPANANIYNKKSVLFFIYGGGFRISSSRLDYYDGRALAALGNVIIVTANYRLGPMGFFYTGTDDAPGNMGLYDILEALKWVHSNINYFGGDTESITLFGQSAGAIAASMFMTSPIFDGLFSRVILDSGAATNLDAEDNNKDYQLSAALAKNVSCLEDESSLEEKASEVVQCLADIDGLTLSKTLGKVSTDPQRSLYPRYGDEILPENARQSLFEGKFKNTIDVLIGSNTNEGSTMITKAFKEIFGFFGEKNPRVNKTLGETIIRKNFKNFPDVDKVVEHYLSDVNEDDFHKIWIQIQDASGDKGRVCPSVYLAEQLAEKGNRVYYYRFTHRPSASPFAPWMGVIHFDEIPFVFGYPLRYPQNYTSAERQLSSYMLNIWTNFAKFGTPSFLQEWPLYSKETHFYRTINTHGGTIERGPHLYNCNFFRKYFEI